MPGPRKPTFIEIVLLLFFALALPVTALPQATHACRARPLQWRTGRRARPGSGPRESARSAGFSRGDAERAPTYTIT